jgi:hypothetical protein
MNGTSFVIFMAMADEEARPVGDDQVICCQCVYWNKRNVENMSDHSLTSCLHYVMLNSLCTL